MQTELLISLVVAAAVFVAGEFLVPVDPSSENRRSQRHFWATVLSMFALVIALLFTFISETRVSLARTQAAVDDVSGVFSQVFDSEFTRAIQEIVVLLEEDFDEHAQQQLRDWVSVEVNHLRSDLQEGFIPIAHGNIENEVRELLDGAAAQADAEGFSPFVIATKARTPIFSPGTGRYTNGWRRPVNRSSASFSTTRPRPSSSGSPPSHNR